MLRPDSSTGPVARPFFDTFAPLQLILLGLALYFFQQFLLTAMNAFVDDLYLCVAVSWAGAMVALPAWIASRHPDGFVRTYRLHRLAFGQAGWLVLVTAALVFASDLLGRVNIQWIAVPQWAQEITGELTPRSTRDWILAGLSLCLVVPLGEEILFRGLIQQATRRVYPGVIAAGFAGLLFGALHWQPWYLLPLCMLGVVLGLVYEVTGTLTAPILVHALYNAAVLANDALSEADFEEAPPDLTTPETLTAAVALAVGVWAFRRLRPAVPWTEDFVEEETSPRPPQP